jgi:hypothetical protein
MNYWMKAEDKVKAKPHTLLGIPGYLIQEAGPNGLWARQEFFARREFKPGGVFDIVIDYERGHPSNTSNHFGMRFNFGGTSGPLVDRDEMKFWPEIKHLAKWHLCEDGVPMYYIENTVFRAEHGQLDLARENCLWPDAPEELLTGPRGELEKALIARLPAMQEQFRSDLAATGLKLHP